MNEYTFEQLNDKEFERLAIDLLSIKFDTLIQRYKDGIDGGIDGKFYADENETVIIQVKHYFKSGFSQLLNKLKKEEKPKVIKLNPKRYIVVTSVPLSPEYKNKIKDALEPYIINDSEIFGNAEINDLLSKNSVIEKKYYKLWISSTTVLQSILSNAINGRSKSRLEDALQDSRLYIKTKNHNSSLKILEKFHTVIISGEPGIGKTSLANALITEYVSNGYQLFEIENYVNEAEQVFIDSIENNDNESKQIF